MKKLLIPLFCIALLVVAGCGKRPEPVSTPAVTPTAAPTVAPTPAPTPKPTPTPTPEPQTDPGTVEAIHAYAVIDLLARGDQVEVLGDYEEFFVVKTGGQFGLIEKRLLRMDGEKEFVSMKGYAYGAAPLYKSYKLMGDFEELALNTEVTVLEDLGDCYLVEMGERKGCVPTEMISANRIVYGGGAPAPDINGGDISLGYYCTPGTQSIPLAYFVEKDGKPTGQATVLTDETELIYAIFDRGETIHVFEEKESSYTIWVDGLFADVDKIAVRLDSEDPFEEKTGYSAINASLLPRYNLRGEVVRKLNANTALTVLYDFGNCLLVEAEGELGYMAHSFLNDNPVDYSYGGGGGGGGEEWTPPAL